MAAGAGLSCELVAAQEDRGGLGPGGTIAGLAKTRHRGLSRIGWQFTMARSACDLIRLPKPSSAALNTETGRGAARRLTTRQGRDETLTKCSDSAPNSVTGE